MRGRPRPDVVFGGIGASFGAVFVFVNAPALPPALRFVVLSLGAALLVAVVWRMVRRPSSEQDWDGPVRPYALAVVTELVAIPAGALILNRVFHEPRLVVLWVVFVVGAHFLPARAFGISRYFELGVILMVIAVGFGVAQARVDTVWIARLGAVIAGLVLLGFVVLPGVNERSGIPAGATPRTSPPPRRSTD